MHENVILAVPKREFVRLNALHLSSFFQKVLLPLQFTPAAENWRNSGQEMDGRGVFDEKMRKEVCIILIRCYIHRKLPGLSSDGRLSKAEIFPWKVWGVLC